MANKILKRMEVLKGFIQIPVDTRTELIGNVPLPFPTVLNGNPARFDTRGRLWSSYLKNRFPVGTEVVVSKVENGYKVELNETSYEIENRKPTISFFKQPIPSLIFPKEYELLPLTHELFAIEFALGELETLSKEELIKRSGFFARNRESANFSFLNVPRKPNRND